jgi:hypothetical protein
LKPPVDPMKMHTDTNAYSSIWRAQLALIRHHPRGRVWWWVNACLGMVALLFGISAIKIGPGNAAIGIGFAAMAAACLYWAGYLATLASTTGGALGHLAPRLLHAQVILSASLLLLLCVFAGVLAGATFGAAACLWAITLLCLWSSMVIIPAMNGFFFFFVVFQAAGWKALPADVRAIISGPWGYAIAAGLAIACAVFIFPAMLRRRRLEHGYELDKARNAQESYIAASLAINGPSWTYNWFLRRDIAHRDGRALALHALGRSGHWGPIFVVGVVSTAAGVAMAWNMDVAVRDVSRTGVGMVVQLACACLLFVLAFQAQALLSAMHTRTGEQALVKLAPGIPAAHRLNRELAEGMLRRLLYGWLTVTVLACLFGVVTGATSESLLRGAGLACVSLLLMPSVLRDYARMRHAKEFMLSTPWVLCLGLVIAAMAFLPEVALFVAPAAVLIAILLCMRGLAAVRLAPPFYPAGNGND